MDQAVASASQHPLTSPNFRLLWLGQSISTFGDRFTTIAIPILVYRLTGSSLQLGIAFVAQVLAALLFGLWAGALTDRWNRQYTMVGADVVRAGLALLLPVTLLLDVSQPVKLTLIYALSFCIAAATQFFVPAKISIIPRTVSKEQLVAANSLDQGMSKFTEFLGYSAAGALIAIMGVTSAFVIDALTFLLSAICILLINLPGGDSRQPAEHNILGSIREGLVLVWAKPILRAVTLISLIAPMAIGALQPLTLVFAADTLGVNEAGYGMIQASIALGLAVGVILIGRYAANVPRGYYISVGIFGIGLFQWIAIFMPLLLYSRGERMPSILLIVSLPFFLLTAVANGSIFLGLRTIIQEEAPPAMIGRVFSVITVVSSIGLALGAATSGMADLIGATPVMFFWSLFLVAFGSLALHWRPLR